VSRVPAHRLDRSSVFRYGSSIGGIVCIAASNGGTTSQDLKTGFLVGSTPKYQQIAILVGHWYRRWRWGRYC